MKIICHRGNTFGPDPDNENKPEVIDYCIRQGYDVEIDLRLYNNELYLGHDVPTYPITLDYIIENKSRLWIHCKDLTSSSRLHGIKGINYFFHDKDEYTLTSMNYVWTYPKPQNVYSWKQVILDFDSKVDFLAYRSLGVHGVCVDYV